MVRAAAGLPVGVVQDGAALVTITGEVLAGAATGMAVTTATTITNGTTTARDTRTTTTTATTTTTTTTTTQNTITTMIITGRTTTRKSRHTGATTTTTMTTTRATTTTAMAATIRKGRDVCSSISNSRPAIVGKAPLTKRGLCYWGSRRLGGLAGDDDRLLKREHESRICLAGLKQACQRLFSKHGFEPGNR